MILEILLKKGDKSRKCETLFKSSRTPLMLIVITCSLILNALIALMFFDQPGIETYMQQRYDDQLDQLKYYRYPDVQKFSIDRPFIILNRNLCERNKPYLIIVVPSRVGNFQERHAIRVTYGSMSVDKVSRINNIFIEHIVKVVFVIGVPDNTTEQDQILSEYVQYGDTVQIDVKDTYYNLSLKMLYAFRWVSTYCSDVKYVLKSDDDTFVHIGILFQQLNNKKQHRNGSIYGKIYNTTKFLEVQKGDSKWSVRNSEYPLRKYPPYAQGSSYTLTFELIPRILQRAIYLPYLHNEDVFLTGILGGKILGAELVQLNLTSDWTSEIPSPCEFAISRRLAKSNMTPDLMYKTWNAISTNAHMCDEQLYLTDT